MAFGYKTGGRRKGSLNRDKVALRELLTDKLPDYDPLVALALIANDPGNELNTRVACHKAVAAYIHPKLKPAAFRSSKKLSNTSLFLYIIPMSSTNKMSTQS